MVCAKRRVEKIVELALPIALVLRGNVAKTTPVRSQPPTAGMASVTPRKAKTAEPVQRIVPAQRDNNAKMIAAKSATLVATGFVKRQTLKTAEPVQPIVLARRASLAKTTHVWP